MWSLPKTGPNRPVENSPFPQYTRFARLRSLRTARVLLYGATLVAGAGFWIQFGPSSDKHLSELFAQPVASSAPMATSGGSPNAGTGGNVTPSADKHVSMAEMAALALTEGFRLETQPPSAGLPQSGTGASAAKEERTLLNLLNT